MKILYVFTVGGTGDFFIDLIKKLIDRGDQVDLACSDIERVNPCYDDWGCNIFELHCTRNPVDRNNFRAIREIRELVSANGYDIVHCHTPIAAFCTRVACRKLRKNGVSIFYTAHGFHFFKGSSSKNWLIFYPLEKMCARWTDLLITINQEDYSRARKKLHARKVMYVPGVGVDVDKFRNAECDVPELREEIGVPEDAFMLLSVGELSDRKNHIAVLKALGILNNDKIHYVIAGEGDRRNKLEECASELKYPDNVHLLGRRGDVPQICKAADCSILPSFQEGLPVALMESMASGLPALGADIRGVTDLIDEERRFRPADYEHIAELIDKMYTSKDFKEKAVRKDEAKINNFSEPVVNSIMLDIYGGNYER